MFQSLTDEIYYHNTLHLDMASAQPDAAPLLLAKVTGYRLLWTAVMVTVGSIKLTQSLEERKVIVTWLDGVLVIILGTMYVYPRSLYLMLASPDICEDYGG